MRDIDSPDTAAETERWSARPSRRILFVAPWVALALSWGTSTWLGLEVVDAIYEGQLSGGVFDTLLVERGERSLGSYRATVWQLASVAHVLAFVMLVVVYTWRRHSTTLLVSVLLLGDAVLVACSLAYGGRLAIHRDGSPPEVFQYVKELSIAGSCAWLCWHRRSSATFAGFAALFAWFFVDDAFRYHERVGLLLATHLPLEPVAVALAGVRPQDVGELLSLAIPLGILLLTVLHGYAEGDAFTRLACRRFVALVALLGVFGGLIDLLERPGAMEGLLYEMAHIEESGEMAVMTVVLVYVISLVWRVPHGTTSDPSSAASAEHG